MATLYVLHFSKPYWKTCRHYIGYTTLPLQERLDRHRKGTGSKLVRYALAAGCDFEVAYKLSVPTREEARALELRVKARRDMPRQCPICQGRRRSPRRRADRS